MNDAKFPVCEPSGTSLISLSGKKQSAHLKAVLSFDFLTERIRHRTIGFFPQVPQHKDKSHRNPIAIEFKTAQIDFKFLELDFGLSGAPQNKFKGTQIFLKRAEGSLSF